MSTTRFYHDIRPIGPSGSFLVSAPTGVAHNVDHTIWQRLSPNRLNRDFAITSFISLTTTVLAGATFSNPSFFMGYAGSPSGATITYVGSGTQDVVSPFSSHAWIAVFPTGAPNQIYRFVLNASGEFGSATSGFNIVAMQRYYYGVSSGVPDGTFIGALPNSGFSSGHVPLFSIDASSPTGFVYYAFRSAAGTAYFTDLDSNLKGGFTLVGSGISFTNSAGWSEPYSVYKSNWPALGLVRIMVGTG